MSTPRTINRDDFNNLRSQIVAILGTGTGSRGYGQAVSSSALPPPPATVTVDDVQWDQLYLDLVNIIIHQTGNTPTLPNIGEGDVIRLGASFPLSSYETATANADANRFNIALSRGTVTSRGSVSYSTAWVNQAQSIVTVAFPNADAARYFFNSGGKIRFSSSRAGGSSSAQNNSWTNLLSSIGTISFSANSAVSNFYTLTGSFTTFYVSSASTPYSANNFRIEARCDIANNSNGGATTVYFRISWEDSYVDLQPLPPNDQVDGVLTLSVEELKATGTLEPSGSFNITSPTFTLSPISAS